MHIGTFAYAYDAVGNRTASTQTITSTLVTTYTYDAANRLTSVGGVPYTWDNNGNLTNDGSKVYTYTQANRLITVTATGLTWNATYNGDGARLRQMANGTPTTYTQDLASPLPVVMQAQTGSTSTQYVFGMGTRPLAEYDSAWEYLLPDGLGSVRQLVDAGGNVKLTESYEPYGSVLSSQGSATSAFGFTGEQFESYIELLYLRARYYDGRTGRFTQRDLWPGRPQRPISLNRSYIYANQNPVNMTDCSGLWPTESGIGDIREALDKLFNEGKLEGVDYQYSCNCGWIDWPHAISGMQHRTSLASRIFFGLKANVDWSAYPLWTGKRGVLAESYGSWQGIILVHWELP